MVEKFALMKISNAIWKHYALYHSDKSQRDVASKMKIMVEAIAHDNNLVKEFLNEDEFSSFLEEIFE